MAFTVLKSIFSTLFSMFQWVFYLILAVLVPFSFMSFFFLIVGFVKGKRLSHRKIPIVTNYNKRLNPVRLLLWDLPCRLVSDFFSRDPDDFDDYGVHFFCGEQGSGKTLAALHFIKCTLERNPSAHFASNIKTDFQDSSITHYSDILKLDNGTFGQIIFLDEIQNWFSSNESRNFPPSMLTEITQQRKQRKLIVCTSQVFTRVSKPIREQATLIYKPMTILGCLTIVRVYKPSINDEGVADKLRRLKTYAFVHTDDLRNCYDTYDKVQRYSLKGFQDLPPDTFNS